MFWRRLWEIFFIFFPYLCFLPYVDPFYPLVLFSTLYSFFASVCTFHCPPLFLFPFSYFHSFSYSFLLFFPFQPCFFLNSVLCSFLFPFLSTFYFILFSSCFPIPQLFPLILFTYLFSHPSSFSFLISENMKISKIQTCQLSMNFFFTAFKQI